MVGVMFIAKFCCILVLHKFIFINFRNSIIKYFIQSNSSIKNYIFSRLLILLNNKNTQELNLDILRKQFAYVGQDVVMFNDTLAANIALGDPNPEINLIYQ